MLQNSQTKNMFRKWMQVSHRWLGLIAAPFLIITGITGAIISWDHELDDWLNPHLRFVKSEGVKQSPIALAKQIEEKYPQIKVASVPLYTEPSESLALFVMPKQNPETGKLFEPGFNQIFLDPVTGKELGKREWGAIWPVNSENFISFLYKLHFSLHLPEMFGTDRWGIWLLGSIAILWTIDCFIAFYITLPPTKSKSTNLSKKQSFGVFFKRWKKAWLIRWNAGNFKLNYDFHRAFGLWTWVLLFLIAFTAFALNLRREVFMPILSSVTSLTPSATEKKPRTPLHEPVMPSVDYDKILTKAELDAKNKGWNEPASRIGYFMNLGVYSVEFFLPEADHGVAGGGHKRLLYDANTAELLGDKVPWTGTAGDLIAQAQFPIHSGRILGLPGRVLISLMGIIVAMLSATGLYIWLKKKKAREITQQLSNERLISTLEYRTTTR